MNKIKSPKFITSMIADGTLLFVLLFFMTIAVASSVVMKPTQVVLNNLTEIEDMQYALNSKDLDASMRSILEEKLKAAIREATQRAINQTENVNALPIKLTAIAQETKSPSKPLSGQTDQRPTGIFTNPASIGVTSNAIFSTIWIQAWNKTYIQVYAGHMKNNLSQGVIYVVIESPFSIKEFLVPGKTGNLTILTAKDNLLTIQTDWKTIIFFDWMNQTILDSSSKNGIVNTLPPNSTPGYPSP